VTQLNGLNLTDQLAAMAALLKALDAVVEGFAEVVEQLRQAVALSFIDQLRGYVVSIGIE
jgi:hypothetical protein